MTLPANMSGVQLLRHGGPDALVWSDKIPLPVPGAGEVLVQVLAAGVNNTDINTRVGWYAKEVRDATDATGPGVDVDEGGWSGALSFPLIQGGDLCGRVVAHGPGTNAPPIGARVTCAINQPAPTDEEPVKFAALGSEFDGAFAQFCKVAANQLFDVSASPLTDVEIAAMPCAYGTAQNLIDRASVGPDDAVLITGASGGVGMAAVQLAKLRGAHVTAIASAGKHEAVRAAGADALLSRGTRPVPNSANVAIDVVGGPDWSTLIDALQPGGRYAVSGAIAGPIVEADLRTIYLHDLSIYGCTYQSRAVFTGLVEIINAGVLRPLVSKTYALSDIAIAQEDFSAKRYPGKLVLIPPEVGSC